MYAVTTVFNIDYENKEEPKQELMLSFLWQS